MYNNSFPFRKPLSAKEIAANKHSHKYNNSGYLQESIVMKTHIFIIILLCIIRIYILNLSGDGLEILLKRSLTA